MRDRDTVVYRRLLPKSESVGWGVRGFRWDDKALLDLLGLVVARSAALVHLQLYASPLRCCG